VPFDTVPHEEQVFVVASQTAPAPRRPLQYESPAGPGQHASVPVSAMQGRESQHMSLAFAVHAPGWPPLDVGVPRQSPAPFGTHCPCIAPDAVLQTSPSGHCESRVHGPHVLLLQTVPFELLEQSALVQQSPATQEQSPDAPEQSAVPADAQQKSAPFAAHAPAAPHEPGTQSPVPVSQMSAEPNVGSP
jgi:hypothetical protein